MDVFDIVIVGSGAAGMSAAQYGARAGRTVLVLEQLAPGGQCMYIESVENYPGLEKAISGYEFAERLEKQAKDFGARTVYAQVLGFTKENTGFSVTTNEGTYHAKTLIWATGAQHRHLDVPGEQKYQGKGISYCGTCDGPFFKNKKILVAGGGDTALTDALYLSKLTPTITICHRKDRFRAQENLIERVKNNKNITTKMEQTIVSIDGDDNHVTSVTFKDTKDGSLSTEAFDAVFIFVGMLPKTELLDTSLLDGNGYVLTNEKMETAVPGLFSAGDVRNTPFRQLVTAASDGAIAAHFASEYIDIIEGHQYR